MKRRRLRIRQIPEDAADGSETIVWERVAAPDWYCEECGYPRNDGWRDTCAYCGEGREDGWE